MNDSMTERQIVELRDELYEARLILEEIKDQFILLRYYPYLDQDRSEARAMENRIAEFLKR